MIKLINDDCLPVLDRLIKLNQKFDAIITDPPYGTTACFWDQIIPFEDLWPKLEAVRKDRAPVILFGSEPFSSVMRTTNIKNYKYDWIWEKPQHANFMLSKYQPNKVHEIISVFYPHDYYPIFTKGKPGFKRRKPMKTEIFGGIKKKSSYDDGKRYPKSIQKFSFSKAFSKFPTAKPVRLMEYLIRTYTKPGAAVLDFAMGSGSTGVPCRVLDRDFFGIEKDPETYALAAERLNYVED